MPFIFITTNAKLAASLVAKKIRPLRIEKIGTGIVFIFKKSDRLREIEKGFRAKKLRISDTTLLNKLTKLLQP